MPFRKAVLSLAVLLLATVPLALAQGTYTQIDVPGATSTGVSRINQTGQMVGVYSDSSSVTHGFVLSEGTFTTIDFPGAIDSSATGINDSGQIVGDYFMGNTWHGFLLEGQAFTSIDFPSATMTDAVDINNSGQIVGVYTGTDSKDHGYELNGLTYRTIQPAGATFSDCNGINNLGDIVGDAISASGALEGFVYSHGAFVRRIRVPGSSSTSAIGVNDLKQIVGQWTQNGSQQGYRLSMGKYSHLSFPNSVFTEAFGINANGSVVGYFEDASGNFHGFTWTPPADAGKK